MIDLKTWLTDPESDFLEGVALHKQYGRDKELQAFLEMHEDDPTPIAASLLRRELARIYRIAANSSAQQVNPQLPLSAQSSSSTETPDPKKKLMIVETLDIDYSKLSPALQAKYKDIKATFKEMCILHDGLKHAPTDAERGPIVEKLKALEDLNAERWADIYAATDIAKELTPAQASDPEITGVLKERRRRNLGIYIAREKKALETETDAERRAGIDARIEAFSKELESLS